MTDARARFNYRHFCIIYAGFNEPRTAARNEQIDQSHGSHKFICAVAGGVLHKVDEIFRQTCSLQSTTHGGNYRRGRGMRLLARTQNTNVAAL